MPETKFYQRTPVRNVLRTVVSGEEDLRRHPADHPRVQHLLSEVSREIHAVLASEPSVLLGLDKDAVVIQDRREQPRTSVLRWFKDALEEKRLQGILIRSGVTTLELHVLFYLLAAAPDRVMSGGEVAPDLERQLVRVDLNRPNVRISRSGDGTDGTPSGNNSGMTVAPRHPARTEQTTPPSTNPSGKTENTQTDAGTTGETSGTKASSSPSLEEKLCRAMEKLDGLVNRRDEELTFDRTGQALKQLLSRVVDAETRFDELHCALVHAVSRMQSGTRRALFGRTMTGPETLNLQPVYERIPPRYRGKLLAREARTPSSSFRSVPNALRTLTRDERDLVDVLQHTTDRICAGDRATGNGRCPDVSRIVQALKTWPGGFEAPNDEATSERTRARALQEELLPFAPPVLPNHDVAFDCDTGPQVGGDYLDVFPVGNRKCGFLCAGINERGWTAAGMMTLFRCFVHSATDPERSGAETLKRVHDKLHPHLQPNLRISAVYGVLNLRENTLSVTNAGAPRPLIWDRELHLPQILASRGKKFGDSGDRKAFNRTLSEEELAFRPGDLFLTFSEGVVRAAGTGDEPIAGDLICQLLNDGQTETPGGVVDDLLHAVETSPGNARRVHDRSALALRRRMDSTS